jgi:hypothetical protein
MKKLQLLLVLFLFAILLFAAVNSVAMSPGTKVLNRYVGTWKSHIVFQPAAWSPRKEEVTDTTKVEWILKDQFQMITRQSDKYEMLEIQRYDGESKKFHRWNFDANGGTSFWIGSWDNKSMTMTWEYVDFGMGVKGKMVDNFIAEGEYQTTLVMEDSSGRLLFLDTHTTLTRMDK